MTLKQRLDQRQIQKLILAPALQQAIKLLPLTNLELLEVIDEELSQNPVLELEEETAEKKPETAAEASAEPAREEAAGKAAEGLPEEAGQEGLQAEREEDGLELETYFQEYFDEGFRSYSLEKREFPALENILSKTPSLWDHLNWQANLTFFESADREIAQLIIGNINEDGYLVAQEEEIARMAGADLNRVSSVRSQVKMFDPIGVGSLDLREALLAQMDNFHIDDGITRTIVGEHLQLLEKSDYAQLSKVLNIPLSEIKHHIDIIKSLDPTPGRKYSQDKTTYVVPDVIVVPEEGELKIALNTEGLPRLRISQYYRSLLQTTLKENPETYKFLKDKMKKALWFLRSLDQRDQTIYKVAKVIVNKQKDFFEKGIEFIKPMTLMEVAQEIGVHESTVGRVVANKYLDSPRGVFSLKYFFHKSLSGEFGEEVSSLMVKDKIRKLVENEGDDQPLSDIEIGEILAKQSLKIARRTVAKYRQQLGIAPSHIRKRKSMMEESS